MQKKRYSSKPDRPAVREPVQAYLDVDEARLLTRLADESGLSKAEVLRQGLRSFARERGQQGHSPMLRFMEQASAGSWPDDVAARHDEVLADTYVPRKKRR